MEDTNVHKQINNNPEAAAQFHHNIVMAVRNILGSLANRVKYWVILNEPNVQNLGLSKLKTYELNRMQLADAKYNCGLFAFSDGQPSRYSYESGLTDWKSPEIIDTLNHANERNRDHGRNHVVLIHQYFKPDNLEGGFDYKVSSEKEWVDTDKRLTDYNKLRHVQRFERNIYTWFKGDYSHLKVIVSEYGADGRISRQNIGFQDDKFPALGWKEYNHLITPGDPSKLSYLSILRELDAENQCYGDVIEGYCLFGLGNHGTFQNYRLDAGSGTNGSSHIVGVRTMPDEHNDLVEYVKSTRQLTGEFEDDRHSRNSHFELTRDDNGRVTATVSTTASPIHYLASSGGNRRPLFRVPNGYRPRFDKNQVSVLLEVKNANIVDQRGHQHSRQVGLHPRFNLELMSSGEVFYEDSDELLQYKGTNTQGKYDYVGFVKYEVELKWTVAAKGAPQFDSRTIEEGTDVPPPQSGTDPVVYTRLNYIRVRTEPSIASNETILGHLSANTFYPIMGSNLVPPATVDQIQNVARWWKIDLGPGFRHLASVTTDPDFGWVRSDVVTEQGVLTDVPKADLTSSAGNNEVDLWLTRRVSLEDNPQGLLTRQVERDTRVQALARFTGDPRGVRLQVEVPSSGGGGASGASGQAQAQSDHAAAQSGSVVGWVAQSSLRGTGDWRSRIDSLPRLPLARVRGSHRVPVRIGPSLGYTAYVTRVSRTGGWYEVIGKNDDWWQLQVDADTEGWVQASQVTTTENVAGVPFVNESPPPALPGPGGSDAPATDAVTANGHFLNLANSWQGAWAVSKTGTTVTAAFQSSRSPVQYLARQNPQDLLVLPDGFRPLTDQDITVTGVHVTLNGEDYDQSPQQTFTLRVSSTGAVRYVNGTELDDVGFLRYEIGTVASGTTFTWSTGTAATVSTRSSQSQQGNFTNRAVHVDGAWDLSRIGNTVRGTISSSQSAVQYAARQDPQVLFTLPTTYRPSTQQDITVSGTRVDENGADLPGSPTWGFTLRIGTNGEARYPDGSHLDTVGYMRYDVAVRWRSVGTVLVPDVTRDLKARDLADTSLELEWEEPLDDGGADITGYRIQAWDGTDSEWDTVVSDTGDDNDDRVVTGLTTYTRYSYRVAARNSQGWSAFSPALSVTTRRTAPGQPGGVATTATHDTASLTWSAPTTGGTVTSYQVERKQGSRDWHIVAADTGSAVTFFDDGGRWAATAYSYRVRALNQGEEGAWSAEEAVTTAATPTIPGQPTDLSAAPGTDSQLQLTWTAPTATGGGVTGYRIERSPDEMPRDWTDVVADTANDAVSWDEDNLRADTIYHYRVSARNSAGVGMPSTEAMGRTRPQLRLDRLVTYPLTAHGEPRGGAAVTSTFASFQPERIYDLLGRVPGGAGWWQVQLFGTTDPGPFWLPAAAGTSIGATSSLPQPLALPGAFTATLANSQVTLTWTAPATGAAVTGYRLWRQTDDGAFVQLGNDLAATVTTHTDSTVQNDHVYYYWVQGLSDEGPGVPSATVALAVMATLVVPVAVTTVTATATNTTLQLGWAQATTGGLPTGYRVAWRESGTTADFQETSVKGTAHTVAGLVPGVPYEIRITAFNQEGDAPATAHTATTIQVAPGVPTYLVVDIASQDAAVSWQEPAEGGRPTAYHLQYKTQATMAWPETHTTVTGLTRRLTGLGYEVAHDLRVRASNLAGESAWVEKDFTTEAQLQAPDAPTGIQAAPGTDSQLMLSWLPASTGDAATGYRIERSADVMPRSWTESVADTGNTDLTWSDSGLAAATTYHYRVTGRNGAGLGTPSNEASGTTRPQAALQATASYPLTAHQWPVATAPVSHTWSAHDAALQVDVVAQGAGGGGWYRVLRFGESVHGPYWLPAAAVSITGATTALPQVPGAPGDFPTPTATHERVTLTWAAPTTGGTVSGYRLWRQTGEEAFMVLGTDLAADVLTYTDTTVLASTAYQYRIQALSAAGAGVRTPAVSVTTVAPLRKPGMPTDLTAAPGTDSQMALAWLAPADPGTHPLTGYRIERSTDVMPRSWTEVAANTGNTDLTWTDSGLDAATTYHYQVSARNAVGVGSPAGETSGTTRPQAALLATASYPLTAHQWPVATAPVSHTWSAHDTALKLDVAGQGAGGGGWYQVLRFGQTASGPYWLPGTAVMVTGATTDVPQAPGVPGDLQTTDTQGQVTLTWSAPATGGTVTGYRLWRQTGEAAWVALDVSLAADALTYTDTTVTADTTYQYRLQAQATVGYGVRTAVVTAVVTVLPAPADPDYVGAAQTAATTVEMAWDAVDGATGYDVEIGQTHGDSYVLLPQTGTFALRTGPETTDTVTVTVTRTGTTLRLTGLPASYSSWNLYLRAANAGGHSSWVSASVTNNPQELAPAPPSGLSGRRSAAGTAALSWNTVTGATAYRIYFDFPGTTGWDWLPYQGVTITVTGTTATVGDLPTTAANWDFRLTAFNGGSESLVSATLTVANTS